MVWSNPYPPSIYWLVAIGLVVVVLAARWIAISPPLRSWLLFLPRCVVVSILLVILFNPVHRSERQLPPKPASVAYLVDCSRSMALDRPVSRIQRAQRAMQSARRQVSNEPPPRIQLFRFGQLLAAVPEVGQLNPSDDLTDLRSALQGLPSRFTGDPPQALVVFSDGAAQETEDLPELAIGYRDLGLPIHVFPTANAGVIGDIAVDQLIVPRRAEPGSKVPVRLSLRQTGFDQARVVVQIRSASRPDAPALASLPVTLTDQVQNCELLLDVDPDQGDFVLDVPPLRGEAVLENNRVPFRLSSRDRRLRVLNMEGSTNNEYRWIHNALQEDPDIECVSLVVNHQYAARPRLQQVDDAYRGYPSSRDELFRYDVVICSDISQGAFTREQIDWTVELVAQRGGGFAMVGGHTSFGSGGWDQTAWDRLIPFDMTDRRDYLNVEFRVRIPSEAENHPIWRLLDDPEQNRRALRVMPQFYGTNLIARVKPAATMLGRADRSLPRVGQMPVFGCESFGRGRTFAMSTDSTYLWGRDFERRWGVGDNRYFRKFWRNVVRWLSENSLAGNRRLHVETDKIIYRPGEFVQLTARAFNESMEQTTAYELTAGWGNPSGQPSATGPEPVELEPDRAGQVYRGQVNVTASAGSAVDSTDAYAVLRRAQLDVAAMESGAEVTRTAVEVQVLDDSIELLDPRPAPENLHLLAELSGGRILEQPSSLADLLRGLQTSEGEVIVHQTPLWDRSYLWLLLVGLLVVEWSLRRRAGFG